MFRIAYVLESGSFVGKAAAVLMLFLIIGVPLFFYYLHSDRKFN